MGKPTRKSPSTSKSSSKAPEKPKLSKWQEQFVGVKAFSQYLDAPLRIAQTGISAGKSRALAWWLIMQMVKLNGCRAIAIAQTHKALKRVLIRELQIVCNIKHIKYTYNKSDQEFILENGSTLFGYSGEAPEGMLGLSEIDILAIDEAAYIPEECFNYACDRMRGGKYKPMVRLISSPQSMGTLENWFSNICQKHPEYVVRATALDNPFTDDEFKANLKDRYVVGSAIYRQQVLGEILDFDAANQLLMRSDFVAMKEPSQMRKYWMGADFSGLGVDTNTVVVIDDRGVVSWEAQAELNTQSKCALVENLWNTYNPAAACADVTGGYGQGPVDLLKVKQKEMTGVNFAQKAYREEIAGCARTEMYLELADEIRRGFWVPEEAKVQLLATQVVIDNRGRQKLIEKELIKKQLGGKSPDLADAIALAVYAMHHGGTSVTAGYSADKARDVAAKFLAMWG